ncbi:MAG: exo-alpha-sialidase [Candidatus Hydrogenedentes bacterium]|nr:exo-alpha-sialidase [Candidatus Hydrogenedentota bacterium]
MLFAIGVAVGALTMHTLDGREITMSNYESRKGTVIVFMSSRCPVTQEQIGRLLQVHNTYKREEVLFVGLCANDAESPEELKSFCQRRDVNFPVYRDPGGAIAKKFGARFTPQAFLLDAKGVLIHRGGFENEAAVEDMNSAISQFLAGKPVAGQSGNRPGTPIKAAGTPSPAEDPIEPLAFASEMVFEKVPWAADHHCSTIAEAPNGDLLCVWFGGSFECADDEALFISRRKRGERAWTAPTVLTRGEFLKPPGNAVVFRVNPTRMMVYYDRMEEARPIRNGRWREGKLMRMYSDDSGMTWSKDEDAGVNIGGLRNAPFTTQVGALMLPISNPSCFLVTRDGGVSWEQSGTMDGGGQPTVMQSESKDSGKTWTPSRPTTLPNPGAGMAMCKLRNGHLVFVYNSNADARTPLSVAISKDDGATWSRPVHLESNPGEYAYPCVIQTSDDKIHVSYTFLRLVIKHAEFSERWATLLSP